jgi:hypothetical protein
MIQLNFAAINVTDTPAQPLPTGPYKVVVTKAAIVQNEGKEPQLEAEWTVAEGPHKGISRKLWLSTGVKDPTNEKSVKGLTGMYAEILLSIGYTAAQVMSLGAQIQINQYPQVMTGRPAFVRWEEGNKDANVRPDAVFIKPQQYEAEAAEQAKLGAEEYARAKNEARAKAGATATASALAGIPGTGVLGAALTAALPAVPGLPGLPAAGMALPPAVGLPAALPAAPVVQAAPVAAPVAAAPVGLPGFPSLPGVAAPTGAGGVAAVGMPAGFPGLPGLPGLPGMGG